MAKNWKRTQESLEQQANEARANMCPFALPRVVNSDEIASMLDDELQGHLTSLARTVFHVSDTRWNSYLWEVELCYAQREAQIRRERHEQHDKYIREQQSLFADDERDLPSADFDNFKYMVVN